MRRKTAEEKAANNRERQARWRQKHKWTAQQRKLACYGKSKAQVASGESAAPVVTRKKVVPVIPLPRYGETTLVSLESVEADPEVMRQQEELARMRAGKQAPLVVPARNLPVKEVVTHTERELSTYEDLVKIVERRKAKAKAKDNVTVSLDEPGVSVEM